MPTKTHFKARKSSPWVFHYVNLTHSDDQPIALHFEFEPKNLDRSFLFILRFNGMPKWKTRQFDISKRFCSSRHENESKIVFFVDQNVVKTHQWAIVGISESDQCDVELVDDDRRFSTDYSIRILLFGCFYLNSNGFWRSDGLQVGEKTTEQSTQCFSTHLTTYAAGFVVLPNPIDFNALDPAFERNLTIYITLILIVIFYALTMAYSYLKDKIDATTVSFSSSFVFSKVFSLPFENEFQLIVLPLHDNNPQHKYLYQIVVFTGMRKDAGTTSKVRTNLSR